MATDNYQKIFLVTKRISPALQVETPAYEICGCYRRHHNALYALCSIVHEHRTYNLLPTTIDNDHVILHEDGNSTSQLWVDLQIETNVLQ